MAREEENSIYDPLFVARLFDTMSSTYGLTNYLSSFGFTERWRWACVKKLKLSPKEVVIYDLMSGIGELWASLKKSKINFTEIVGIDISPNMNMVAIRNSKRTNGKAKVMEQDILNNTIASNSADIVISSFGLKTFSPDQLKTLASQILRILKPGGQFSFVEVSVPSNRFLKFFYMFYLKRVIPIIGVLFQGNSRNYSMLGVYTEAFGNSKQFYSLLKEKELSVNYENLFFGCATITWGSKR